MVGCVKQFGFQSTPKYAKQIGVLALLSRSELQRVGMLTHQAFADNASDIRDTVNNLLSEERSSNDGM